MGLKVSRRSWNRWEASGESHDKFERFEKAMYGTTQRSDETHESYLARHDHQFEELIGMKVGMEEF